MKRSKLILLIFLCLAGILLAVVWVPVLRQPSYKGKRIGSWISQAVVATKTSDRKKLREAEDAVKNIGGKAVPYLRATLQQKPSGLRDRIITVLLTRLKLSSDTRNRLWSSLMGVGSDRSIAALLLGAVGSQASPAIPDLVVACTDAKWAVRMNAIGALGKIRARPDLAISILISSLKDQHEAIRQNAAWALQQYGTEAASAAEALELATSDPVETVQLQAAQALCALGTKRSTDVAVNTFIRLLGSQSLNTRLTAVMGLRGLGSGAKAALPYLGELRSDPSDAVRNLTADAIKRISDETP